MAIEQIAKKTAKPIAIAYKDYTLEEYKKLEKKYNNFTKIEDKEYEFEKNLTLLAIVGIMDPIREDIKDTIKKC